MTKEFVTELLTKIIGGNTLAAIGSLKHYFTQTEEQWNETSWLIIRDFIKQVKRYYPFFRLCNPTSLHDFHQDSIDFGFRCKGVASGFSEIFTNIKRVQIDSEGAQLKLIKDLHLLPNLAKLRIVYHPNLVIESEELPSLKYLHLLNCGEKVFENLPKMPQLEALQVWYENPINPDLKSKLLALAPASEFWEMGMAARKTYDPERVNWDWTADDKYHYF